jgi:hypothetical protein
MSFKHLFLSSLSALAFAQRPSPKFPYPEKLVYNVQWRMVTAGTATVQTSHPSSDDWQVNLNLESAGMVNRLYRVLDTYKVVTNDRFCASSSVLNAEEGKHRRVTRLTFENTRHKLEYDERDLVNKATVQRTFDIPPCIHDVTSALAALRAMNLEPGRSATLPVTDGKKIVNARIEAQSRENLTVSGKSYHTIRYEAFLFDNVLYKRKGRMFVWLTDDGDRTPVQFRFQLGFPIGTISIELERQQRL